MPAPEDRTLSQTLGVQLQEAREARGISRRAMAEENDMSDVSLLHYEHGTANPTLSKIETVAAMYGLEVDIVTRPAED